MHRVAFATNHDGIIAHHGTVEDGTIAALERLRAAARKLILVTGRELPDLPRVTPRLDLFDLVVAGNGALLCCPDTREQRPLAEPPPERFLAEGVDEATWEHRRRRGDHSRWLADGVKNRDLAEEAAQAENSATLAAEGGTTLRKATERRHTAPG